MKPSSLISRLARSPWFRRALTLAIIASFYGIGYGIGYKPQIFSEFIDLTQSEVLFYVQDPQLLPSSLRAQILTQSQVRIRFIVDDPDVADISLLDLSTVQSYQPLLDLKDRSDWNTLFQKVSPDFQTSLFQQKHLLPLLWRLQDKTLKVVGLWIPNEKTNKWSSILRVEKVMLQEDFQKTWLSSITWGTTILKMDETSLPESRKASAIRSLNLNNVHF